MLNERPAEPGGWKDKLDLLDGMAGEPWTGKEAAWDKLHTRLHKKPAKKKGMWWLAAAIFLLFALTGSLLLTHKKENVLVKTGPVHTDMPAPAPAETTHPAIVNTVANAKHRAPKQVTAKTKKILLPVDQPVLQQVSTTEPIKTDTPLLASAPAPKKLRVIHINELEDPRYDGAGSAAATTAVAPAMAGQARRYVLPTFRFVLTHIEAPATVSYEKTSTGNNPLKIKIPTQN
ncbi:MAG TPA: hypothetical protein VLD19_13235 [Chitinophagaceae bacterium]|nr:hypothetical protein [Chitinophagaceae bacterium]